MTKRRNVAPPADPRKTACITLPDGRLLQEGEEVTVKGEGRFTFHYGYHSGPMPDVSPAPPTESVNGSTVDATCYGPVNSKSPMWRTFRASAVHTIHKRTSRKVATP